MSHVPIYEIEEVREENEEDINTHRDLVFERLHTEYGEDDEEQDYEIIAKELSSYSENAIALLCGFIILEVSLFTSLDTALCLLPLGLQNFKILFLQCFALKLTESAQDAQDLKKAPIKKIIHSIGNLIFYTMLAAYFYTSGFYFICVSVPLILAYAAECVIHKRNSNQCQLFSAIVSVI